MMPTFSAATPLIALLALSMTSAWADDEFDHEGESGIPTFPTHHEEPKPQWEPARQREPILDDYGNVITRSEIFWEMDRRYQTRCVMLASALTLVPAYLVGRAAWNAADPGGGFSISFDRPISAFFAGIGTEVSGVLVGYFIGKHVDRRRAIERIREQRRREKELSQGWHEMPNEPHVSLLTVAF